MSFGRDATSYHGDCELCQSLIVFYSDYCGNSVTGLFCLRVSMRDRTPLFTLVETRRDTESLEGDDSQALWEGGRATKHFWYRSWKRQSRETTVNNGELPLLSVRLWTRVLGSEGKLDWFRLLALIDSNDGWLLSPWISFSVCGGLRVSKHPKFWCVINKPVSSRLILWLTHSREEEDGGCNVY